MPTPPDLFERGDLITADRLNYALQKMYELESRIEKLEAEQGANTSLQITRFNPPSEQRVGRLLEIVGSNFEIPPQRNAVSIDGVPVTQFSSSTSTRLRVTVPPLRQTPKDTVVEVTNENGQVTRLYRINAQVKTTEPQPSIERIVPEGDSKGDILNLNNSFILRGEHFAKDPAGTIVTIRSAEKGLEDFEMRLPQVTAIDGEDPTRAVRVFMENDVKLARVPESRKGGRKLRPDAMEISVQVGASNPATLGVAVAD